MNPFLPLLILCEVMTQSWGLKPIDVYWNISNPIFSAGFGAEYENVIEVNRDTHPWQYDQVRHAQSWSIQQDEPAGKVVSGQLIWADKKKEYFTFSEL